MTLKIFVLGQQTFEPLYKEVSIFDIPSQSSTLLNFNLNISKLISSPEVKDYNDLLFEVQAHSTYPTKIYTATLLPDVLQVYNNFSDVRIVSLKKISDKQYVLKLKSVNGVVPLVWIEFKSNSYEVDNILCKKKYNENCRNNIYHYFDDNGFSMTTIQRSINFYIFSTENNANFFPPIKINNFQIKTM